MAIDAKWPDFSNLDAERAVALAQEHLPGIATLILVVIVAWQAAGVIWQLIPASPSGDPITVTPPPTAGSGAPQSASADVETIAAAHLFGEVPDDAPIPDREPDVNPEELAETRLSLTLKGTMAGSDNRLTIAIIADSRNEEQIYTIGDAVTSGTTLHAVYTDQVVLDRSGNLEALKLPKDLPISSAPVRRQATSVNRSAASNAASAQSIQNVVTQNATKLADVIRPTPYFVGGQQQGYRVYPGRDRRQFAALGLRPGDLIKDIDGAALTDPQQAMQIFQNLGTAEQVSVTVERNGQPQVLVLSTSQLNLDDDQ